MKTLFIPTTALCGLLMSGGVWAANGTHSPLDPCPGGTDRMQQPQIQQPQIQQPQSQQPQSLQRQNQNPYEGTSLEEPPGLVGDRFLEDPATSDDPVNKLGIPESSQSGGEQSSD